MSLRFRDQNVCVTGASRGLGRAIATAFGREGAHVWVNYHQRADEAERTLAAVRDAGGDGALLPFDVRDRAAVKAALQQAVSQRRTLDVLVCNAGILRDAPLLFQEAQDWEAVLATNLTGVFHCVQAALPTLLAQGRGAIVSIGSVAGLHASPGQASYSASKGGLSALTRTLAAEVAPRGVRVNCVAAGLLSTGMAARLDHRLAETARARIPLGRFGEGDEVAQVVLFLASEEARYIVGQTVVADGGLTL